MQHLMVVVCKEVFTATDTHVRERDRRGRGEGIIESVILFLLFAFVRKTLSNPVPEAYIIRCLSQSTM